MKPSKARLRYMVCHGITVMAAYAQGMITWFLVFSLFEHCDIFGEWRRSAFRVVFVVGAVVCLGIHVACAAYLLRRRRAYRLLLTRNSSLRLCIYVTTCFTVPIVTLAIARGRIGLDLFSGAIAGIALTIAFKYLRLV